MDFDDRLECRHVPAAMERGKRELWANNCLRVRVTAQNVSALTLDLAVAALPVQVGSGGVVKGELATGLPISLVSCRS